MQRPCKACDVSMHQISLPAFALALVLPFADVIMHACAANRRVQPQQARLSAFEARKVVKANKAMHVCSQGFMPCCAAHKLCS